MKEFEKLIKELDLSKELENSIMKSNDYDYYPTVEEDVEVDIEMQGVISVNSILCSTSYNGVFIF